MKPISVFALLAVSFVASSAAYGQISLYGTNFDGSTTYPYNDPAPYTDTSVSGQDLVGQGGWVGNDDPSVQEGGSQTYHGGLNSVTTNGATNPVGSGLAGQLSGQQVIPAGNGTNYTVLPGQASVYVAHPVTLSTAAKSNIVSLNTDFDVSTSSNSFTSGYGFSLQNSSFANLLAIQFIRDPSTTNNPNGNTQDIVQYQIGSGTAVTSPTNAAVLLNHNYHLTIAVNMSNNTFSATLGGVLIIPSVSLGTTNATTTAEIAALQFENGTAIGDGNGGVTNGGQDTLTFDNIALTVPEPSTYAAMAVGALALVGAMRLRRRQA